MARLTIALFLFFLPLLLISQENDAAILEYGRESIRQGKAEEVVKELEVAILRNDEHKPAYLLAQGLCYWALNQPSKAKVNVEQLLETELTNSALINCDGYWLLGNIYESENKPNQEIAAFKKALTYRPTHPEIRITLALALIENNKNEEALLILNKVISEGYEHSFIYNNLASGLLNLDKLGEAKDALDRALQLDPENPFVYYNYYQYFKKKRDLNRACENLSIALSKDVLEYGLASDLQFFESIQQKECKK